MTKSVPPSPDRGSGPRLQHHALICSTVVCSMAKSVAAYCRQLAREVHSWRGVSEEPVCPKVLKYLENTYYLMINHQKQILYGLFLVENS
jgi:hypothetical protein